MRAKTVENKIAEFLRKLKNRLFEPKFWFGPCRSKKSLSDQHNRFPGFPMYRGFNIGGGPKWFWDFDNYPPPPSCGKTFQDVSVICYLKLAISCKNLIPFAPVVRLALVIIYGTDIGEIYATFNIWFIYGLYMNKIVPMYQFDMN